MFYSVPTFKHPDWVIGNAWEHYSWLRQRSREFKVLRFGGHQRFTSLLTTKVNSMIQRLGFSLRLLVCKTLIIIVSVLTQKGFFAHLVKFVALAGKMTTLEKLLLR